jgi:hypothetical protein
MNGKAPIPGCYFSVALGVVMPGLRPLFSQTGVQVDFSVQNPGDISSFIAFVVNDDYQLSAPDEPLI